MLRRKGQLLLTVCAALFLVGVAPAGGDRLYTVSSLDEFLRVLNPYTGKTISSVAMSVASGTIRQSNGLARHPLTGDLWVMLKIDQVSGRSLGTVDVTTGVVTTVGSTGDKFASIAFDSAGVLYVVTGDGAATPESLYTIDLTTANTTLVMSLGNGNDGEAVGFHPGENVLYHASGLGQPNVDEIFERVDPVTKVVSNITLRGDDYEEAAAIVHYAGGNFLLVDVCGDLFVISNGGAVSHLSAVDHSVKGLAYVPASTGSYSRPYGTGCPGTGGHIPILMGVDEPAPTLRGSLELANAPGGGIAFLAVGVGTQPFALAPGCDLQIAPLTSFMIGLPLSGAGPGRGRIAVGITIPKNLRGDGYWQFGIADAGRLILSNPLQWHIE